MKKRRKSCEILVVRSARTAVQEIPIRKSICEEKQYRLIGCLYSHENSEVPNFGIPSVSSIFRMVFALLTGSYPDYGNLEHKLRINVISSSALAMIKCKHGQLLKDLSKRFLIGADLEKEYANEKESGAFDRYIYRGGGFFLRRRQRDRKSVV